MLTLRVAHTHKLLIANASDNLCNMTYTIKYETHLRSYVKSVKNKRNKYMEICVRLF